MPIQKISQGSQLLIELGFFTGVNVWAGWDWLTNGLSPLQSIVLGLTALYTIIRIVKLLMSSRGKRGLNP